MDALSHQAESIDESGHILEFPIRMGPAGLDPLIVTKLNRDIIAILATAEMQERIQRMGYDVIASTPEEFGTQMKNDVARWSEVVRRANIPMN